MDQDFFDENKKEDNDKFGDEDLQAESDDPLNTQVHPLETNAGDKDEEYRNGLHETCTIFLRLLGDWMQPLTHQRRDKTACS